MYTLIPYPDTPNLIELSQFKTVKFSFVNKKENTLTEIIANVLCRDFLGDVLIAEERKEPFEIYRFRYNPNTTKIDRDKTRLSIHILDEEEQENLFNNLSILNMIEESLGQDKTQIFTTDKNNIFFIEGSNWWLQTTIHLSFYTFLIKCLLYKYNNLTFWKEELKKIHSNEANYMRSLYPVYDKFISFLTTLKNTHKVSGWDNIDLETLHNYSGFFSIVAPETVWKPNRNEYNRAFNTSV